MTLLSEIAGRSLRLPRAQTRDVVVERDLPATMDDGVVLLADRYIARAEPSDGTDSPPPTVLIRTPYGRRGFFGFVYGRLLAERGFQTVVQSVRGTFGSGGEFTPFDERADGLATLRWLRDQPWCEGPVGMIGSSYMGLTQWAVASAADGSIGALAPSITASQFHGQAYGGGSISLDTALSWMLIIAAQERRLAPLRLILGMRRSLPRAFDALPLQEVDALVAGEPVPFFREWFDVTAPDDPYWTQRDFSADVAGVTAPVQLIGGWQDIFLPWLIEDYVALRRAGRTTQLVVGPWAHTSPGLLAASTREGIAWLRAHLAGDRRLLDEAPVRVWVGGENAWRALPDWPPPGVRPWRLHLRGGGRLAEAPPPDPTAVAVQPGGAADAAASDTAPDRFRYDPNDPTPALGGPVLLAREPVTDNRPLEARADVLTFTTAPLEHDVEALGPVEADLHVRTSSPYADVFVRVCDVEPDGRSLNVCDALIRLTADAPPAAADGSRRVSFQLWPTAHRFGAGHRVRVLVAGGAHPRYARNAGTGEPPQTATRLVAVDHELLHDAAHPSAVVLSVRGG
ncbi:CocE/NonD family hydrolase [Conexibacter woesei]|uniref:X-Pro dipeptidyl-peptidase domain protein n=1 Tax=Conexibacter woesei (strain DSM 14684 / CCUG 47730 / CIP 108061 / JCM 11494 / NBRC 100937 / ID131577) TaxID=469383 RepID=D3F542_CONWI|nr:CocE/NonD family hydrolase [Conexibacter woesei]ADB48620.1 X-Pro dipeptidyl-peptidase domain protein [Conexibacter woesei DSM 14684]